MIKKEFFPLLLKQRSILEAKYNHDPDTPEPEMNKSLMECIQDDFDQFEHLLPDGIQSIADIGCGFGCTNILLSKKYPGCKFYLFDNDFDDNSENQRATRFDSVDNFMFYNNLAETKRHLIEENIPEENLFILEATKENIEAHSVDLTVSFNSWGWHYPLDVYLESVSSKYLLIDIRTKINANFQNQYELLEKYYKVTPARTTKKGNRLFCERL